MALGAEDFDTMYNECVLQIWYCDRRGCPDVYHDADTQCMMATILFSKAWVGVATQDAAGDSALRVDSAPQYQWPCCQKLEAN
jgi:hypothetical protein